MRNTYPGIGRALGWVVAEIAGNVLRYGAWLVLAGCADYGAAMCGQPAIAAQSVKACPPTWRRHKLAEFIVIKETTRGIAQTEAFLSDACELRRDSAAPLRRRREDRRGCRWAITRPETRAEPTSPS